MDAEQRAREILAAECGRSVEEMHYERFGVTATTVCLRAITRALTQAQLGWRVVPVEVSQEMHVAACKVLLRAPGLDGLPQRMLNAMLAAAPAPQQGEG